MYALANRYTYAGLGGLPASNFTFTVDTIYTVTVQVSALVMPSESTIMEGIKKGIDAFGIIETISVNRALFSSSYEIAFRAKKAMRWDAFSTVLKNTFSLDLGYDATVTDFKAGMPEKKTVTDILSTSLADVKWIVIGGAVIVGFIYLGPFIKRILPKEK